MSFVGDAFANTIDRRFGPDGDEKGVSTFSKAELSSKFNGKNYLQKNGTATGSKNSCSYSDLALEPIDEEIFKAMTTIYKEIHTYYRYRDDCFLLWVGTKEMLYRFVYFVNILDPSLRFTVDYGGKSLKILDLLIKLEEGKLTTTVYSKPTDGHLYLNNASCHPKKHQVCSSTWNCPQA